MEYPKEQLLGDIQEFKRVFDDYYQALNEYLKGEIIRNSEFQLSHPTLFSLSNQLQVVYLKLPQSIQTRLMEVEFDVFLHCNNIVDFYSYRLFLLEKERYKKVGTIAVRIDSEIDLVRMLVENDIFDKYLTLPKRNFIFYRGYDLQPNLIDELKFEYVKQLREDRVQNNIQAMEIEDSWLKKEDTNQYNEEKDFFNNINGKVDKIDKFVDSANSIINNTVSAFGTISSLG